MFVDMGLFMFLAWRYKSVSDEQKEELEALQKAKSLEGAENDAFKRDE